MNDPTLRLAEGLARISERGGERAVVMLRHGTLDVKLAFPTRPNDQTPHAQDELYVIVQGRGFLRRGASRDAFRPGDALFVAAGAEHRFEEASEDLLVWRIFYGPPGGEAAGA